jgi:pimeloyl-ACP methyl ester carboxylesterase
MPDLVGFGSSPQPAADYTAGFHLRWLEPVVAETPRWLVIGHSMGCVVAVELARRRPQAVVGLVLFNAPVYSSPERMREVLGRQNLLTRLSLLSPIAAWFVCEASVCTPRPLLTRIAPWLRPDVPPEAASDYSRHTFDSYYTSLTNLVMGGDLMRTLAATERPALVVQGSEDDVVEGGDRLSWPPNVRTMTVEGADHTALLLQTPDRAATIVRDFLASGWVGQEPGRS